MTGNSVSLLLLNELFLHSMMYLSFCFIQGEFGGRGETGEVGVLGRPVCILYYYCNLDCLQR